MKIKFVSLLALLIIFAACMNPSFSAEAAEPVAYDASEGAYLYVIGENQLSLQYKGITGQFAWATGMLGYYPPDMRIFDYDNDGEKEIAVSICLGTGTGVAIYELHIVKVENGTLTAYTYEAEDYKKHIGDAVSFKTARENGRLFIEFTSPKDRIRVDVTDDLNEDSPEDSAIKFMYGDIVRFVLGDNGAIELQAVLGANVYWEYGTEFYADLTAKVVFVEGGFKLSDIRLAAINY